MFNKDGLVRDPLKGPGPYTYKHVDSYGLVVASNAVDKADAYAGTTGREQRSRSGWALTPVLVFGTGVWRRSFWGLDSASAERRESLFWAASSNASFGKGWPWRMSLNTGPST